MSTDEADLGSVKTRDGSLPALAGALARDTAKVLAVLFALGCAYSAWRACPHSYGTDSHAYWLAWRHPMYGGAPMTHDAYLYSPAFAQAIRPLTLLPWLPFAMVFSVILGLILAWLLVPLRWWAVPLWVAALPEIISGNIFIPLAVVAVFGLRHRWVWAFAALTKITPCLGPVWFAVRREWRQLGVCMAATAVTVLVSLAISPHLWVDWLRFLHVQASKSGEQLGATFWPPLTYRLPVALVVVAWAARTDRRWALPVAMVLASPVMWLGTFTMLAAIPRIRRAQDSVVAQSVASRAATARTISR